MYIGEIEKANNYLKMLSCQMFEEMHISDRVKDEFINKVTHVENRPYFYKKLAQLCPESYQLPGLQSMYTGSEQPSFVRYAPQQRLQVDSKCFDQGAPTETRQSP